MATILFPFLYFFPFYFVFNEILKARHLVTGKFHALKVIEKKFILDNRKEEIIINEKEIMINVKHPHIVKIDYIF